MRDEDLPTTQPDVALVTAKMVQGMGAPAVKYPTSTVIGRYVVVRALGHGGMGAVMLAFDTQLCRRVALKVLHTHVASEESRVRLVREAQAMARLAHPNVIGIYDVGVHDGNVFLAMEYVDGTLLSAWIKQKHSVRDILAIMKQAGRGLAAANQAGLIHRDFKPANVIIARDGRVCVFDFGIALTEGTDSTAGAASLPPMASWTEEALPPPSAQQSSAPSPRLTQDGSMLGTIGYASPEQTMGETTDSRSDVFSFCVTLWRALYGRMPFDSRSLGNYVIAVNGKARPARPVGTKVPAWLHRVVERGLALERDGRFASMKELLSALDADPTRTRRRAAAVMAVALCALAVGLAVARHTASLHAMCVAEGEEAPVAWRAKRDDVQAAMRAETDAFASHRTDRTLALLDDYATALRVAQTESCEATRVAQTQSNEGHERRSECLLERRTQLDVLADVLAAGDQVAHRQSLALANALDTPQCNDASLGSTLLRLPRDPSARAKVLFARRDIVGARLHSPKPGGLDDARRLAERARDAAREANDAATEAMALAALAHVQELQYQFDDAVLTYLQAAQAAEAIGADKLAGSVESAAAFLLASRLNRGDEARRWLGIARAKLARLGGDDALDLSVVIATAAVEARHDPREGLALKIRALVLATRLYGPTGRSVCIRYNNVGYAYLQLGEPEKAEAMLKTAVDCHTSATGPDDEDLVLEYSNLFYAQEALGRRDDAFAWARRASQLSGGTDASTLALESLALTGVGNHSEATTTAARAIDVATRRAAKNDNGALFMAEYALGLARAASGDTLEARDACARALAIGDKDGPDDPADVYFVDPLRCLGEAELALGDVRSARLHLERSVALLRRHAPGALDMARFALARALVAPAKNGGGTDEPRAISLAEQARDELRGAVATYAFLRPSLDAVEAWIANRRTAKRRVAKP